MTAASLITIMTCGLFLTTALTAQELRASAVARADKRFRLLPEGGFTVAPIPSYGLGASYYLSPDTLLSTSYTRGSIHLFFFNMYARVWSLGVEKFWGNSFYTRSGVAHRTVGGAFGVTALEDLGMFNVEESVTSLAVDVAVGNMWQWDKLSLGVDWVGILWPIATLDRVSEFPEELVSPATNERKERWFDQLAMSRSLQVMRFRIGVSF